jgi:hypothetical protein
MEFDLKIFEKVLRGFDQYPSFTLDYRMIGLHCPFGKV